MPTCAVFGCKNYPNKKNEQKLVHFYRFPKVEDVCKQWVKACGRTDKINVKIARICSEHFAPECGFKSKQQELLGYSPVHARKVKVDAIPTIKLPHHVAETECSKDRSNCPEYESRKNLLHVPMNTPDLIEKLVPDLHKNTNANLELELLRSENERLKAQLHEIQDSQSYIKSEVSELKIKLKESQPNFKKTVDAEVSKILGRLFTPGQIHMLLYSKKKTKWSHDDISSAMSFRSVISPKTYHYLRNKLNYPLPAPSTLRKWAFTRKHQQVQRGKQLEAQTTKTPGTGINSNPGHLG